MADVTQILSQIERGDPQAAERLLPLVYAELRRVAQAKLHNERPDHTLQATALVHEAYLRLVGNQPDKLSWDSRGHFFAAAGEAMRRILIESVRQKNSQKRGGHLERIDLDAIPLEGQRRDEKLLALDDALDRLEKIDPIKAQLVKLRFFSGLTIDQAAQALGISPATAQRSWTFSRAWLQSAMRTE
jgi:RNA polymerase sigma factor (TIGR02999 family)